MAFSLSREARTSDILALAADVEHKDRFSPRAEAASRAARAAIRLIKLSRSLPAVIAANMANIHSDLIHSIIAVEAGAVGRFCAGAAEAVGLPSETPNSLPSGLAAPLFL